MVLRHDEESKWGAVEAFFEDLETLDSGPLIIDWEVWGRVQRSDQVLRPGDGFAFYHSSRAKFPKQDRFGRKPRMSLVGQLESSEQTRQDVSRIKGEG